MLARPTACFEDVLVMFHSQESLLKEPLLIAEPICITQHCQQLLQAHTL